MTGELAAGTAGLPRTAVGFAAGPGGPAGPGGRGVLEGAFGLLAALERAGTAGLTRLAADCGLPKTTAHRLLDQLTALGAVERGRDGYRMGPRIFRLGQRWQPYPGLRRAAWAPARRLARSTGTMVGVSVLSEGQTLVLDWTVPESDGMFERLRADATWPWWTAAGKVLVAGRAPGTAGVPEVPLPDGWWRSAREIRESGVAFDREELVHGVCCVAVPLHGAGGATVASLCAVTDPRHRLDRLAEAVRLTARTIGEGLRRG